MKKFLSIVLSILMVMTMIPLAVMPVGAAAAADITVTIDTGASVTLKDADSDGYYDIGTANDLYAFAAAVNGGNRTINGELTADITVNQNVLTADGALNGNGSNFRVWTPIGGNSYTYDGTFDGGEHTVSGLYFNNSSVDNVGMFGSIDNGGKVMNVGVIDSYLRGIYYVGGVAGYIKDGTVENSYNTGTVTGSTYVGGMVGKISGTVMNCYNTGTVFGSTYVGGVVGYNGYKNGIITNCHNTGSVSSNGNYVGGVVGRNDNIVTNSYNTGSVSGSALVAGVVGSNESYAKNVENCYNIGTVTGADYAVGGVAGRNSSTVTNCYYLNGCATDGKNVKQFGIGNDTLGSTTADVAGTTTGKTSIGDICIAVGYHSIDENCVCTICGAVEHNNFDIKGFCTVCEAYQPATLNADGYYEIGNAGQLFWFANYINTVDRTANAVLTADIDLEGRPWTPIGFTGENNNNFRGIFDGQNHTIEGLYVEGGRAGLGFFGEVRTGTVKNFTIYGEVVANTEVDYIGGVIGSVCGVNGENDLARNGAVIQNITSYVNLTAKKHGIGKIGGFVGYANHQSLIENCSWYGTFDAGIYRVDSGAGGFIGKIQENTSEVTIRNCGAYGTIKTNYAGDYNNTATIYMGGFLSFTNTNAQTTLENCLFAGQFERGANLTDEAFLGAFGTVRSVKAIVNCYYLGDDGLEAVHSDSNLKPGSDNVEIKKVTAEQLKSGEVAYKLQGTQSDHFWGQTIGTDNYPILGGEKVYYGYTSCADEVMVYSNDSSVSAANPAHVWGEGVLTRPTKTQEGYYTYTCTACGEATKTEEVERAANYADYTKALEDLRAYLDSDMLTDENKSNISVWLAMYDSDEAYGFIAGEEATVQEYIDATAYYASEFEAAIEDCLAGNHSGNGDYCEVCGEYIHTCDFTGEWKYDADKHWKECTCGLISEEGTHTGGTATCTTQAVCTTCGAQYGDFSKTNHTFDNTCCGYYGAEGNEQSVWWTLVDGTLTIGGTGAMADNDYNKLPWHNSIKSVTALVIQEGVTHIGDHSFMTCKMESVYIPASVKTIGASAFWNCINLKDVTFAAGSQVTELGDASFQSTALEQITIPASVTSIGFGAFDVNFSLTDIFIEEGNTSYKDIDGVLYTTDGTLVLYPINKAGTEFTTPDGVTKIAKFAFGDNKNLRTVTLSEGVTTIEEYAFLYCESLQTLTIPASVTSIGDQAFEMTSQLTDIFVDEDNTSYKDIDGVLYTTDGTLVRYPMNKAATEFTTPEGVTKIAAYAFNHNKNLRTITLSEGVTTIEESAFQDCNNLQTLTIPASITAIAEGTLEWYFHTVTVNLPCNWDGSLYTFYEQYVTLNYSDHVADETAGQTCKGYKCTVCGAFYGEVAADAHDWSNKDGICANGCGAECTHENQTGSVCEICGKTLHVCDFSGEWKTDADKHWKECSCGLISEEGTHTGGTATCTTQAVCESCGASYGEVAADAHDWSNKDGICANGCGAECTHENQNGNVCEVCGAELHVCDFTGEWKYDADKHWKECSCGLASEEGTHTGGTATCTTQAVCETCGASYGEVAADAHDWSNKDGICANGCGAECTHENQTGIVCEICGTSLHTCDFTGEWKADAEKHWKECECGLLSEEGTHEYMEFYPICQICNYFEGTEIAVGETISIDNKEIIKFAPEVSGTYILSSFGGGCDPRVNLYDGEMFPLGYADNYGDSKNFRLEYEFTEGEVYYFQFVDSEFRFGYQIKLECETHAGSTQTCGGYKCDVCGELFGEGIGEHTGGTQNCSGYKCEVCGKYYGESIGEHVGGEATCAKKAVCDVCGEEYGELDKDNHTFDGVTCGYYGVTGDEQSVWWIFEDGILTIGGTGAMKDKDDYSIPWYYFRDEITAVAISDGVTRIGRNAFAECRALSSVVIPASVETIGYNAFGRCTSLESVTFAEGSQLTAIEENAFYFCYVLKQITLPEKVNNIHPTAFYYSDVYNFIVDENNTTYKAIEGLLCSTDGTLVIYPSGRTSNTFTTPEGVTAIGERAFENCTSLNYIILSEGIKTIEEGAFVGSGLETVTISSTVTSISENAFSYCYNLNTVNAPCNWDGSLYTFEEGVTINISDHADKNSDNLCDGCGISLHTCDFTGEWKYDADTHWKECTSDDCDKISEEADHDFLNGECTVCDYVCDHANATSDLIRPVQNADGTWGQGSIVTTCPDCGNVETESVDRADYTAFDAAVAKLQEILAREDLIDGPKATVTTNLNNAIDEVGYNRAVVEQTTVNDGAQRINGYIAMLEAGLADGTMKKADLSYMTALLDEVNALIDSNPNNIVSSEIGNYSGPYSYYRGQINNGNLTQAAHDSNMVTYGYETQLETLLAGLKDGTALKADYTEIDEVIAAIDEALKTASVTEDMQAELDSIKKELDAYKANTNVSVAMLANSGLLAKAEAIAETMNNCANGVHVFTKYEVVDEPACEVAGKEVAVCDNGCGATDEKAVEALGHTELPAVKENEVAATCENAGSYDLVVYCDVCKAEVSRTTETVEALGHTELPAVKENEVAADCENAGSYDLVVYCDVCKAEVSRTTETVEALGHTELPAVKENEVAADCENAGSYDLVVYCDVCKAEVSRTTETVEALGHTELPAVKENEVAADCENAGSYDLVVYCDVCKAEVSRTTETVEALGHAFTVYTVTAEPTCEEAGKQVSVCDNGCGATDEQSVAALGHTEETVKGYAATCTATGLTDGVKCSVCDKILTAQQTIAQTAHKDDNGDYKCDYGCGHEFEKPVEPEQPDDPSEKCDHICHKDGILGFLWKIIRFFYRLFNIQQHCDCGVIHYDAPVFG